MTLNPNMDSHIIAALICFVIDIPLAFVLGFLIARDIYKRKRDNKGRFARSKV